MNKLSRAFSSVSKEELPKDLLWPEENGVSRITGRRIPFVNYLFFSDTPYWNSLQGFKSIFDWFATNPILYAVVMIKAREYANMRFKVVNKYTGVEEDPLKTRKPIPQKIYKVLNNPNVMQARWEFLMQRKINLELAGNAFTYGNFSIGFKPAIDSLVALWNVWPAYMEYKLAGKYFEATTKEEIVKSWKFKLDAYVKTWEPWEILHNNKPNTTPHNGLIFGTPTVTSLVRPLTNIDMAYESRNVIMKNRGMRVMLTSAKGDATGALPLLPDEQDQVHEAMKKYGMREGQQQFFFSPVPLNAVPIDQDVSKLGLFDEIATDAMTVCNAFGVPEVLLKLYIKGTTFENQEASVRRLYQGTLIPEAEDDCISLSRFLGLDDTDWIIVPDYSHVAALQESEKLKAEVESTNKKVAMDEVGKNLITLEEYRTRFQYGAMPKPTVDPNAPPTADAGADTRTLEAQAQLRGSVGGVTGMLALQASVGAGTTTYDAGIAMLILVFGYTEDQAKQLLGDPKTTTTAAQPAA